MSPKKYIFFTCIINILDNGEKPEKMSLEFLRDCVMLWNKKARTGSTLVQFVNVVRKRLEPAVYGSGRLRLCCGCWGIQSDPSRLCYVQNLKIVRCPVDQGR